MVTKLHFISGLPRSGSTLMAAVLRQNPRFTAGMTSPVAQIYQAAEQAMAVPENAVFLSDEQRQRMLHGLFESYYADTSAEVVFDTSRMWTTRLPALVRIFPEAKVICMVRELAWIVDSFERLFQSNPFQPSGIYGFQVGTLRGRCDAISGGNGVVGYAFNGLKEALYGKYRDRIMLVEYDDFCANPLQVMSRIYQFIGEPPHFHDFSNVEYSAGEFDLILGAKGLHEVSGPVKARKRESVLPPDIFHSYDSDQFWRAAHAQIDAA